MKKLPVGIQEFREIVEGDYLYVDKTREIHELITSGKYFFLSRPRRFGKSLLINTIKEIFLGARELFKGFYIYDKIDWKTHPVIRIDFSVIAHSNPEILQKSILAFIDGIAKKYHLQLSKEFVPDRFGELLEEINKATGSKIVVLIDEYDKPIIDHIEDTCKAKENREVLREFYGVLKSADSYLRLVLITGVSKFAKVSIFSGLNNLLDITLDSRFSTILGITQSELEGYFGEHLARLREKEKKDYGKLLTVIRSWYNGYSWDGENRIYNPFSILNLMTSYRFSNYWFATGTPTFLTKLIQETGTEITEFEKKQISEMVLESSDLTRINLFTLLFQTGYLTIGNIKNEDGFTQYTLGYPNLEVKTSFLTFILEEISGNRLDEIQPAMAKLKRFLRDESPENFIKIIRSVFAKIPSHLYIEREAYYHSLFYIILTLAGVDLDLEILTDKGRIDGVVKFEDKIYVIEFKYGQEGKVMERLLDDAVNQIKSQRYYERFSDSGKQIFLFGVGFVGKEIGYKLEKLKI